MDNAGQPSFPAGFDVYDGSDIRAGTREPTDQRRPYIANPLTDQFPVAVVMGLGEAVREQRAEQRIDCSKHSELNCHCHDHGALIERQLRNDQCRQAGRNCFDTWCIYAECDRARGYDDERH